MSVEAKLRLQISEFTRNYDTATAHAKKRNTEMERGGAGVGGALAKGFSGVGARLSGMIGLGAGIAAVKAALVRADDLADLKIKLNETAETLQRVDYAAQQTASMGVEQVARAFVKLEQNLGDIENTAAVDAMENLGLSAGKLMGMPLDEKLIALSGAFQTARDNGTGVADLMDLLGRSGGELIPMLGQSKEALDALFADAPVMADGMIDQMAILNDRLDGMWAKAKNNFGTWVGGVASYGAFAKDFLQTGSTEEAYLRAADRELETIKNIQRQRDAKAAQEEAMEAQRKAAAATVEEAKAAEKLKGDLEKLADLKERVADGQIDLLPDDEKVDALRAKLEKLMGGSVGMFPLNYEMSDEGLRKLAEDREANKDLPASGVNSAAEAYGWVEERLKLTAEIAKLEEKIGAEKKKASDELATLREEAEEGRVGLLPEEEQTKAMRDKLGKSLGVKITGMEDIEKALGWMRSEAKKAREAGDTDREKLVLEELSAAQQQVEEFQKRIEGTAKSEPGKQGEFQTLVDEIFNRDPAAEQLRALEDGLRKQDDLKRTMDDILKKMDDPVPRDTFSDFGA